MFKIGDFSKLTQVSIRMLRYYDEHALLKPAHTDPWSGYRYYTTDQIDELHKIIFLRDIGYTTSEIRNSLANWNAPYILMDLEKKKAETAEQIRFSMKRLETIEKSMTELEKDASELQYNFALRTVAPQLVISMRKVIADHFKEGLLWKELSDFLASIPPLFDCDVQTFAIYHYTEHKEQDVDVEVCLPIKKIPPDLPALPAHIHAYEVEGIEKMACSFVSGPFERIAGSYLSFARWLTEHPRYEMGYPDRQICHKGPWNEENPELWLTEIQIPVQEVS